MARVGRNREKHKRMLKGWTPIGGAVYFVPTNKADLAIVLQATGGKKSLRLGALNDHNGCAATFTEKIVNARRARDEAEPGSVGELVMLAFRDILPTVESPKTREEWTRYWNELRAKYGHKPYARSIHEAALDPRKYFSALDVQAFIDAGAESRPVAANRAVDAWAIIFDWARNRWGRTEYNPCRGVEKNDEEARDVLPQHQDLYRERSIYRQLSPPARFILNMYRYYGRRRGETLRLTLADVQHEDGVHMLRGKERQRRKSLRKAPRKPRVLIIPWDQRLRRMVDRYMVTWRSRKVREGLPTTAFLVNRQGLPFTEEAAKSAWRRGMERSGQLGQFVQHDVRALRATTLPFNVAQDVLAQDQQRTTELYRRGPKIIDLKGHK